MLRKTNIHGSVTGSQGLGGEGLLPSCMGLVLVDSWCCSFLPVLLFRNQAVHLQISLPLFTGQQRTVVQDERYICGWLWHQHSSQSASLFTVLCQVITSITMCPEYISFSWLCCFSSHRPECFSFCHRRDNYCLHHSVL